MVLARDRRAATCPGYAYDTDRVYRGGVARGNCLIALAVLLGSTAALADGSPGDVAASVRLLYQRDVAAESCPDTSTLQTALTERLGFNPFDDRAARVLSCRVQKVGRTFRAHIEVGQVTGEAGPGRELVSKSGDCQELAQAIELALSIAIHPLLVAPRPSPEPPAEAAAAPFPSAGPAPPSFPPAPPDVVSAPTVSRSRNYEGRWGLRADATAGLDLGFSYGGALSLGLRRRSLSGALELHLLAPSAVDVGPGSLRVWQWAVLLVPCGHRGEWAACLVGSAGMLYGRSEGFAVNGQSQSPFASAGARGAWEHAIFGDWLRLSVSLDLLAALTRNHFTLGSNDTWTTPPVAVSLGVGVQGAFF